MGSGWSGCSRHWPSRSSFLRSSTLFFPTSIPLSQGTKLLVICLVNVSVAMTIGLAIMNLWQPGLAWLGHVDELLHLVPGSTLSSSALANVQAGSQSPIEYLASYIPRTLTNPFSSNNIIGVVLLALLPWRALCDTCMASQTRPVDLLPWSRGASNGSMVGSCRSLNGLSWLSHWPSSASSHMSLAKSGVGVFSVLWIFLVAMLAWPCDHSLSLLSARRLAGGKEVTEEVSGAGGRCHHDGFVSCNSSLATVPVTLRCLERMQVSAAIGTSRGLCRDQSQ